jgi:hypothetical protein
MRVGREMECWRGQKGMGRSPGTSIERVSDLSSSDVQFVRFASVAPAPCLIHLMRMAWRD